VKGSIYRWTCAPTGHVYIGSSKHADERRQQHINALRRGDHHCKAMQADFDAHGEAAFEFMVLESDVDALFLLPREWFQYLRHQESHYPISDWRIGVIKPWSDERRAAHSIALTGRVMPPANPERGTRISAAKKGKKMSAEHIAAISVGRAAKFLAEVPLWRAMLGQGLSIREIERQTGRSRRMISRMLGA
jgi:group I intron endonuclease